MMNIFRICGKKKHIYIYIHPASCKTLARMLTCSRTNSRPVPCVLHFHSAAKNEILEREIAPPWNVEAPWLKPLRRAVLEYHSNPKLSTSSSTRLDISVGNWTGFAAPCAREAKTFWWDRHLLDLHLRLRLEHHVEAALPVLVRVHRVLDAQRLQAHP